MRSHSSHRAQGSCQLCPSGGRCHDELPQGGVLYPSASSQTKLMNYLLHAGREKANTLCCRMCPVGFASGKETQIKEKVPALLTGQLCWHGALRVYNQSWENLASKRKACVPMMRVNSTNILYWMII